MSKKEMHIYYRSYGSENDHGRPAWYNKELCLTSLLLAFNLLKKSGVEAEIELLFDGRMNLNREWDKFLSDQIDPVGVISEMEHRGNRAATMEAINRASDLEADWVLFCEDDYLWLLSSLLRLIAGFKLEAELYTPYDHPVRYENLRPGDGSWPEADWPHWYLKQHTIGEGELQTAWKGHESTCMTFATTPEFLMKELSTFEEYVVKVPGNCPQDRTLFRHLQGLRADGNYPTDFRAALLLGPTPSLATHVEAKWLAPGINWEEEAARIVASQKLLRTSN